MVQCFVVRPAGESHEFLQMRRAAGDFMGGTWQTVYGTSNAGETAWQAALRELGEETGLWPTALYQLDTVNTFYLAGADTLWHVPMFCAMVDSAAPVALNPEHDDFRWMPRAQAMDAFMWPGERNGLVELCREILDDGKAKPYLRIQLPGRKM